MNRLWKFIHNTIAHPLLELPFRWTMRFHDWSAQKAFGHLYYIWWLTQEECQLAHQALALGRCGRFEGSTEVFNAVAAAHGRAGRGRLWPAVEGVVPDVDPWPDTPMGEHCSGCAGIIIEAEHVRYIRELPGVITDFVLKRIGE